MMDDDMSTSGPGAWSDQMDKLNEQSIVPPPGSLSSWPKKTNEQDVGAFGPIVPPPEKIPEKDRTITERKGGVNIINKNLASSSTKKLVPLSIGELRYCGDPVQGVFSVSLDGDKPTIITHKSEDIIKLAHAIQADQIKELATKDQEGEVDHLSMANELLLPPPDDGTIQVLEGNNHPDFSLFPGNNVESLRMALHYIEANNLKEVAPWSCIWNLWKCLEAKAEEE